MPVLPKYHIRFPSLKGIFIIPPKMSWQGSTHQLVVWIELLGTGLRILIPSANGQEGTTEKILCLREWC